MVNETARENEIAWIDYAASLGEEVTGKDLRVARHAFMAGRVSAQQSVQRTAAKRCEKHSVVYCAECYPAIGVKSSRR